MRSALTAARPTRLPRLNAKSFELTTNNGTAATYAGEHTLIMSRGHGAEVTMTVDISAPSLRRLY